MYEFLEYRKHFSFVLVLMIQRFKISIELSLYTLITLILWFFKLNSTCFDSSISKVHSVLFVVGFIFLFRLQIDQFHFFARSLLKSLRNVNQLVSLTDFPPSNCPHKKRNAILKAWSTQFRLNRKPFFASNRANSFSFFFIHFLTLFCL